MSKARLIDKMRVHFPDTAKKDHDAAAREVFYAMGKLLEKGEKITIPGFGTFSVKEYASRKGRNPQTGEEMILPASKRVLFKASSVLKSFVNE